jgi:hypothetical protein
MYFGMYSLNHDKSSHLSVSTNQAEQELELDLRKIIKAILTNINTFMNFSIPTAVAPPETRGELSM